MVCQLGDGIHIPRSAKHSKYMKAHAPSRDYASHIQSFHPSSYKALGILAETRGPKDVDAAIRIISLEAQRSSRAARQKTLSFDPKMEKRPDQLRGEAAIVLWATVNGISFEAFRHPLWKDVVTCLNGADPQWLPHHIDTLVDRLLPELDSTISAEEESMLQCDKHISLIIDGWTAESGEYILGTALQWIDKNMEIYNISTDLFILHDRSAASQKEVLDRVISKRIGSHGTLAFAIADGASVEQATLTGLHVVHFC